MSDQGKENKSTVDRRSFLKLAGFSVAGAAIAGCERTPVEKAIPFLIRPEEIVPGKATWYASTCSGCPAACGILVKHRDGRPIKVEGNPDHPVSKGGVCVVGQAILLGLYDSRRLDAPRLNGVVAEWSDVDRHVMNELDTIRAVGGKVRFLTGTVNGPTTETLISRFMESFADGRHVQWEPMSYSAILDAHERTHGLRELPRYSFDRAGVIVSFEADFLGAWISPVEFTKGYTAARSLKPGASYSKHFQFESHLSITGSKADVRFGMTPGKVRGCLAQLDSVIGAGTSAIAHSDIHPGIREAADALLAARGRSLVVCGHNDTDEQILVNRINQRLGNYGSTIDVTRPSRQHRSDDASMRTLLDELERGEVRALFISDANPVCELPNGRRLADLLSRVPCVVSFAEREDETSAYANFICPVPHTLECWSDAEPHIGIVSVAQPAISPFGGTRPLIESLAMWLGRKESALDMIREHWRTNVFPCVHGFETFDSFWDKTVHDGYARMSSTPLKAVYTDVPPPALESTEAELSLLLYQKAAMPHGRHAHNAWLHEVPDPVTKLSWDNCALLSPSTARRLGITSGDVIRVSAGDRRTSIEIPAWPQEGQPENVVAIALGYGRAGTERFSAIGADWFEKRQTVSDSGLVGVNAAPLIGFSDTGVAYTSDVVTIERTGGNVPLACSQPYGSLDTPALGPGAVPARRPLIQETTLREYLEDPSAGSFPKTPSRTMWPEEHSYDGHHWGMVIDINACTGCSACVVSCQAENNIPVVGKDEVMRNREMHWLRVDRYMVGDESSPSVAYQPMLCHQCDNAPCETVCPVEATVHSSEGLNQQVYNRCVGTRYCANNCPYKIRRFNWFDYPHDDQRENMILNPDVVVRSRGVMEKCSFCYQRIQEAKIEAKRSGRDLRELSLKTACEQSCPADAIRFGDMNDHGSAVAAAIADPRHYRLLEELEVRPSVGYMTVVHNRNGNEG